MGALDGRVAIITGAGRGLGREHALLFAAEGAKVVVNDLGGEADGSGGDATPAQQVVAEIEAMGGQAVANGDNVADWDGAQRLVQTAIDTFGDLHVLVNNAGILRDRVVVNMTEAEWDAVIHVHLKGHFCPTRMAAAYWREQSKAGNDGERVDHPHVVDVGAARQPRPGQLRRGQERDRHALADLRQGAEPLRRALQRDRAGGAHPAHRGHARARRGREGPRGRRRNSTYGTRPMCPRSSPISPPRIARSTARHSSCRAAWCSGSSRGGCPRRSTRATAGPWASWSPRAPKLLPS